MLTHIRAEAPDEACGLLAGAGGSVQRIYLMENVAHSRSEYRMDPAQQVRVMLEIEAAGRELIGIFHSHPAGPPVPSPTDVAQAYYPEAVHLVFAPDARGDWMGRGFKIDGGHVEEVLVQVE